MGVHNESRMSRSRCGLVDRTGWGHTVLVGRLVLGHTLPGWLLGWDSTGHYEDSTVRGASAGYWVRIPPGSQAARGRCLNVSRAT